MNKNFDWFKNKYGLMIHFGLYSTLGGEYNGEKSSNYAEWIQSYFRIPNKEMEQIAVNFNPINFNADEIAELASNNGFSYIVFVTKHHDGFALFNSQVDNYNIYKYNNRDLLQELYVACKKHNIKLGIYYSQDLDWHEPNGGGFTKPVINCAGTSWCNNWDFNNDSPNFDEYFYRKSLPQIEEIMTRYGEISIAWFDIPFTLSKQQSKEIYNIIQKHQPNCLINSRIGNGEYDYVSFGDNEVPNSKEELETITSTDNDINGVKVSRNKLYEVCATLTQSWGYTKYPRWKDVNKLKMLVNKVDNLGINLLINISPDGTGKIDDKTKFLITEMMKKEK